MFSGGMIARLSGSIFYGNALLSLLLSIKFLNSWETLSSVWLSMETTTGLNFPPDVRIKKRTIFVTGFVATFACGWYFFLSYFVRMVRLLQQPKVVIFLHAIKR